MSRFLASLRAHVATLWRASAPLTALGLLMLAVLAASLIGLWLNPRTILGAPAWLKPAKFAASIAVFALTLAWALRYLPDYPRFRRNIGRATAVLLSIEILIIAVQAARGTTSHFNVSTPLNGILFSIMGIAIAAQTLASVAVAVALWRQKLADRALGWALRLGLSISILGASIGGLMVEPNAEQLEALKAGRGTVAGAHTVGAPDGGPGLAGTGWSLEHGDLRVPHFLGLHAFQALPLLALGVRRRRGSEEQRVRLIQTAGASYVGLVAILLWQALRGQPLLAPDAVTVGALLAWSALSLAFAGATLRRRASTRDAALLVS